MALDSTVGGADATSYVTEAAATGLVPQLCTASDAAAWSAATVDERENALARSALALNALDLIYIGVRATAGTQALSWPRAGAISAYGRIFGTSEIPKELIKSQVIYAAADLAGNFTITGTDETSGVIEEHAGPVGTTYRSEARARGIARSPMVMMLIEPLTRLTQMGASRI